MELEYSKENKHFSEYCGKSSKWKGRRRNKQVVLGK
jgi:hypothetical protein